MPTNPKHSVRISWSDEDDAYIADMPLLPYCKTHGSTHEEAAMELYIEVAQEHDDKLPESDLRA